MNHQSHGRSLTALRYPIFSGRVYLFGRWWCVWTDSSFKRRHYSPLHAIG